MTRVDRWGGVRRGERGILVGCPSRRAGGYRRNWELFPRP